MYKKLMALFSRKKTLDSEKKEKVFTNRNLSIFTLLCMVFSGFIQLHHHGYLSSASTYDMLVQISFPIQEEISLEKKEKISSLGTKPSSNTAIFNIPDEILAAPNAHVIKPITLPLVEKPETKMVSPPMPSSGIISEKGKIILIIAGLGLNNEYTKQALSLPSGVTLGFSPYVDDIDNWIKRAEEAGHDTLLHLPLEPGSYPEEDAGPFALISRLSLDENQSRLLHILEAARKTKGLYSDPNEKFSFILSQMGPVLRILKRENIPFIYGQSGSQNSVLIQYGAMIEHPVSAIDTIIDKETSENAIKNALIEAEMLAKTNGFAILYAHPYPVTLEALKIWLSTAKDSITLTPVSSLFPQKGSHDFSPSL